ncbi:ATP-binding protein [Adhaeribacter pallidiroseus]|uniref:ATPase family 2 protein n=1 Tax=Adhaeribacter pallidiroseus TaxID=2072847 RepID=A0A369QDA2_9BACT|nr:ATP-binding protein [Adhaeribacter pallidiroseus]RDC62674.1 ATPase family 2 protein [Adhaeribacter pallidiroseus]
MTNVHLENTTSSSALKAAFDHLRQIITQRLQAHFNQETFNLPDELDEILKKNRDKQPISRHIPPLTTAAEWIVIALALVPHIQPSFFESIITEILPNGGDFPEFGGVKGTNHRGMLPTGETAQFIIAGDDVIQRLAVQSLFEEQHFFYQNDIVWLESVKEGEPRMSGRIILAPEWVHTLLTGADSKPKFSPDFPAKLVQTKMDWSDLILHPFTAEQIDDIKRWFSFHHILEADGNLSRKINQGYRVLFHGPPGTGKTLTAGLMGKEFKKDVYRVDLSQIVSKYIGETEKNLSKIFDRAEHKDWILFFDEADALFGKRTNVQSSHDKYANQEVSFLLQRVEDFKGLLILASNYKSNMDEAFLRRFHAIVHFPMPNSQERLKLWQQSLPTSIPANNQLNLAHLAEVHELSGASILNIVQFASLKALSRPEQTLHQEDLLQGIRREFRKEEKSA